MPRAFCIIASLSFVENLVLSCQQEATAFIWENISLLQIHSFRFNSFLLLQKDFSSLSCLDACCFRAQDICASITKRENTIFDFPV